MNDQLFWRMQVIQLQKLLADAKDDPILAPQLRERLEDAQEALNQAERIPGELLPRELKPAPRVALFMRGSGVKGSEGIRPSLAGEALIQYEKIYAEQAMHDERVTARDAGRQRRRRGSPKPELLFTGTPRGSFGLEFIPQSIDDPEANASHIQSLYNVADLLEKVSNESLNLEQRIKDVPPRILQNLKKFFKVLASHDTELRIAFEDRPARTIKSEQIHRASNLLEEELLQDEIDLIGVFRGLTRESLVFDFLDENSVLIKGTLDETLTEEDFDRIDALTNQKCTAKLQKSELRQVSGAPRITYVLIDAQPFDAPPIQTEKTSKE